MDKYIQKDLHENILFFPKQKYKFEGQIKSLIHTLDKHKESNIVSKWA